MSLRLNLFSIEKRKILIGAGLAAALSLGLVFLFVFEPLGRELKRRSSVCSAVEAEVARARVHAFGFKAEGGAEKDLIPEKEAMPAIAELTQAGKAKGIQFVSVTPRSMEKQEGKDFRVLPVEIELLSSYRQLSLFLSLLDDLEKILVTVESFSTSPSREKPALLATTLLLRLYLGD